MSVFLLCLAVLLSPQCLHCPVLTVLVQQLGCFTLAVRHCNIAVLLAVSALYPLNRRLLFAGAKCLPCFIQFRRLKLCCMGLQLGILFECVIQFGDILGFMFFQLFQLCFGNSDGLFYRRKTLFISAVEALENHRFFGTQFLQQFRQLGNTSRYDRYDTEKMTVTELKELIWRYYMRYWNNRRICSANDGLPPLVKRQQYDSSLQEAA